MQRSFSVRRLVFQLGTVVFLLGAVELVARSAAGPPAQDPYRFFRLAGADGWAAIGQQRSTAEFLAETHRLLENDPRLLWRLRSNLSVDAESLSLGEQRAWMVTTGADGLRDRPLAELPEGERRVLALGDSTTFGWGVDDDEPWPAVLEQAAGPGWQVINAGVPGYSSLQGRLQLEDLAPGLAPDVVVAGFGANDGHMVARTDAAWLAGRETLMGQARYAVGRLRFVQLGRKLVFPAWAEGMVLGWRMRAMKPRVTSAQFEEALEDIARHVQHTVLIDVCARAEYSQVMRELARVRPDIDLVRYDQLHGETLDGCHPTPAGHEALAGAVARLLGES